MCWGKAEHEFEAWQGRMAEDTPEKEREPRVEWREPEREYDEREAHEREEVFERV